MKSLKILANTSDGIDLLNFNHHIMKKTHLFKAMLFLCLILFQSCQKESLSKELFKDQLTIYNEEINKAIQLFETNGSLYHPNCLIRGLYIKKKEIPLAIITAYQNLPKHPTNPPFLDTSNFFGTPDWEQSYAISNATGLITCLTVLISPYNGVIVGYLLTLEYENGYHFLSINRNSLFFPCVAEQLTGLD